MLFFNVSMANAQSGDVVVTSTQTWPEGIYNLASLTVAKGATLTVEGGTSLNITGNLTVTGNSTIIARGKNRSVQVDGLWQGAGVTISCQRYKS